MNFQILSQIRTKQKALARLNAPGLGETEFGLLEMMDEHRTLNGSKQEKNWYAPYTNSIDLKQVVRGILEPRIKPQKLVEALGKNTFPLFSATRVTEELTLGGKPSRESQ